MQIDKNPYSMWEVAWGNRGWITDTDNCQLTLCGPLCAEPIATTESVTTEAVTTTITKQRKVENKQ